MRRHAIGLMLAAGALLPAPALAQDEEVSLAYPNVAFTFAAAYVAEDAGLSMFETHRALNQLFDQKVIRLVDDCLYTPDLDALSACLDVSD